MEMEATRWMGLNTISVYVKMMVSNTPVKLSSHKRMIQHGF